MPISLTKGHYEHSDQLPAYCHSCPIWGAFIIYRSSYALCIMQGCSAEIHCTVRGYLEIFCPFLKIRTCHLIPANLIFNCHFLQVLWDLANTQPGFHCSHRATQSQHHTHQQVCCPLTHHHSAVYARAGAVRLPRARGRSARLLLMRGAAV